MSPRPARWMLPAMLGLALALRLLAWHGAVLMTNDGPDFLWQAERLRAGDLAAALSHPYHPLYALATALVAPLTGSLLHAALAVSILSGLGIVLAVRALAARLFPERPAAAELAALLAAVHGRLVITTSDIQSDGLFLALAGLACAALLASAQRRCGRRALLAGVLTGLAYLARPEALFLVGLAGAAWLLALRHRPGEAASQGAPGTERSGLHATGLRPTGLRSIGPCTNGRRSTGRLALFVVGAALCVVPYMLVLHDFTGRWALSLKPSIAAAGLGESGAGLPLPADAPLASPKVFRAAPGAVTAMPDVLRRAPPATASQPGTSSKPAQASGNATLPRAASTQAASATPRRADDAVAIPEHADDTSTDADAGDEDGDGEVPRGPARPLAWALWHAADTLLGALRVDTALLALVGWLVLWRARRGAALAVLAVVAGWYTVDAAHAWLSAGLSARHTLLATVILLPVAGLGFATLWAAAGARHGAGAGAGARRAADARRTAGARRAAGFALRGALVLVLVAHAASGVRPRHVGSEARLSALAWAAAHTAPGDRLAVHRRKDSFYSGRPVLVLDLPCFDAELADKLRSTGVALLVLDEVRVRRAAPHWLAGGAMQERARFGDGDDAVLVLELVAD